MKTIFILILASVAFFSELKAQMDLDSLLSVVSSEAITNEKVMAGFKTTRVINSQSFENTASGTLDVKISHRFGLLSSGSYELFGLDQSSIRLGLDYGITDRLMIGLGRSSYEKTYDGFIKYKLLWQSSGKKPMPVSVILFSSVALKTLKQNNPDKTDYFSSRLFYTYQVIVGRKFSESLSLQLMPSFVHRNWVETVAEENDVWAIGIAGRQKITKRVAITGEYYYVFPNQLASVYKNSLSLGFDIETGGHVFQLMFTNSTSMIEKGFITETTGDWLKGEVHFGFNISRVFTITEKRSKE